jgi:hypothetical protein
MKDSHKRMPAKALAIVGLVTAGLIPSASPLQAQATTETSNQRWRFENQPVPVAGRGTFIVNGGVHVLLHSTLDASGGCHLKGHADPQGLSVKAPTGETYRAAGAANFTMQSTSGQDGTRFHGILNLNLIGKGQAPDIKMHINTKTPPVALPAGCDAEKVGRLIVESIGITLPNTASR